MRELIWATSKRVVTRATPSSSSSSTTKSIEMRMRGISSSRKSLTQTSQKEVESSESIVQQSSHINHTLRYQERIGPNQQWTAVYWAEEEKRVVSFPPSFYTQINCDMKRNGAATVWIYFFKQQRTRADRKRTNATVDLARRKSSINPVDEPASRIGKLDLNFLSLRASIDFPFGYTHCIYLLEVSQNGSQKIK